MNVIRREHVRIRDIIRLHLLDILGIRNRNQHILARHTECFLQNALDVGDMLDNLEQQNRIE